MLGMEIGNRERYIKRLESHINLTKKSSSKMKKLNFSNNSLKIKRHWLWITHIITQDNRFNKISYLEIWEILRVGIVLRRRVWLDLWWHWRIDGSLMLIIDCRLMWERFVWRLHFSQDIKIEIIKKLF